jgi:hypothetical protein
MAYNEYDRRHGQYDRDNNRNWFERATDEVSSWFSDDDDAQPSNRSGSGVDYGNNAGYGTNSRYRDTRSDGYRNAGRWGQDMHRPNGYNDSNSRSFQGGRRFESDYYGDTGRGDQGRYTERNRENYGLSGSRHSNSEYDNQNGYGHQYDGSMNSGRRGMDDDMTTARRGNFRSYGSDRGYNGGMYEGSQNEDRYGGGLYNEQYGRTQSMSGQGPRMNGTSMYSRPMGSHDSSDRSASRFGQERHNYDQADWSGMERDSNADFDQNTGRSGRNDWSNQRQSSDQGFGRSQDYNYRDKADRDYTRGYGNNQYGSRNGNYGRNSGDEYYRNAYSGRR